MHGFMWNPAEKLSITEEEHKTLKAWAGENQSSEDRAACTHLPVGCRGFAQQGHRQNLEDQSSDSCAMAQAV